MKALIFLHQASALNNMDKEVANRLTRPWEGVKKSVYAIHVFLIQTLSRPVATAPLALYCPEVKGLFRIGAPIQANVPMQQVHGTPPNKLTITIQDPEATIFLSTGHHILSHQRQLLGRRKLVNSVDKEVVA